MRRNVTDGDGLPGGIAVGSSSVEIEAGDFEGGDVQDVVYSPEGRAEDVGDVCLALALIRKRC